MRVSQSQLPYQIAVGLVEAMDPRGTHDVTVRTSGGRVHARARTCIDDIGIGDEVVMLRLAGQIEWIILGRILNQYNAESTEEAVLAPPLNFTVTGFRGFLTAQWDAVPDTQIVAWQVEEAADDSGSPDSTHTEAIITQGSYYIYLCTTTNATVRHFRVRSIRYLSANNLQYSAWSDWTSSTSLVWDDRYYTETEIGAVAAPSGASLVGVEDAGTYFTGTDVEAALQELGAGTAIAELHDITHINFNAATELTISNGEITAIQAYHTVDTEGDAADDLLDVINGGEEGEFLIVKPAHTDRTVVINHGVGNIFLWGQADISLNDDTDCLLLYHDGANWLDLGGQGTGAGGGGVTDHGALTGLGDDDHAHYLLANGSRNLAGNLGVDAAVTIDGVDISVHAANVNAHHAQSHKDLHDPEDGGDPLDCAAAVATGTAGAEGSAHSFARSDHVHALHNHDHTGDAGDGAQISHDAALTGVSADDHHNEDHAARHVRGGADEVDGDALDIDWNPTHYTPATIPAQVTNVDELTAHLYGIDLQLGADASQIDDEPFLTLALSADLSAERLFTPGAWLVGTDAGAGGTYTLDQKPDLPLHIDISDSNKATECATIQDALDACAANDLVIVPPAAYTENLTWPSVGGVKLVAWAQWGDPAIVASYATTLLGTIGIGSYSAYITGFSCTGNITMNGANAVLSLIYTHVLGNVVDGGTAGDLHLMHSFIDGDIAVDALSIMGGWVSGTRTVAGATTYRGEVQWANTVGDHLHAGVAGDGGSTLGSSIATITVANNGLHVRDTNASHDLIITPGSDLEADRSLTLVTGDASRTITLSGNPTLSDWFDQTVKIASTPTFDSLILGAAAPLITTNTADASDTKRLVVCGGGGAWQGRGASFELRGNEYAAAPGDMRFIAGDDAAGGAIRFYTEAANEKVTIARAGQITFSNLGGGGNQDVGADNNGMLYVPFVSDAKFKYNVLPITNALEAVCALRGVEFDWNTETVAELGLDFGDRRQLGFIAHEVEEFIPLAVLDSGKGYKSVNEKKIVPYLAAAIRELRAEIESLKNPSEKPH